MFPLKFVIYGQVDHLLNLLLWAAKEKKRKNINDENHTKKRNHAEKRNQKKQKKEKESHIEKEKSHKRKNKSYKLSNKSLPICIASFCSVM